MTPEEIYAVTMQGHDEPDVMVLTAGQARKFGAVINQSIPDGVSLAFTSEGYQPL